MSPPVTELATFAPARGAAPLLPPGLPAQHCGPPGTGTVPARHYWGRGTLHPPGQQSTPPVTLATITPTSSEPRRDPVSEHAPGPFFSRHPLPAPPPSQLIGVVSTLLPPGINTLLPHPTDKGQCLFPPSFFIPFFLSPAAKCERKKFSHIFPRPNFGFCKSTLSLLRISEAPVGSMC